MAGKNTNQTKSLTEKVRSNVIDGVKITAVSGVLAFLGLNKSCLSLPSKIGITSAEITGLQTAIMAFDVGAGVFAGFNNKYGASLAIYTATLIPELYDVFKTGDLTDIGKRVLAKTIVYGGSYALGYIFKGATSI